MVINKNIGLLRFPIIGGLLLTITYVFGETLAAGLIPIYQWEINNLDSHFHTTFFGIVDIYEQKFLRLDILISDPFFVGSDFYVPDIPIQNSTTMPLGNVLLPLVLLLTIVLAWPTKTISEYFYRLVLGSPLIMLVMMLDIPIQFVYMLWDGIQKSLNPEFPVENIFSYWSNFLNGGGLIALSLACGAIAVGCANSLKDKLIIKPHK